MNISFVQRHRELQIMMFFVILFAAIASNVMGEPRITTSPENVTAAIGESVEFKCIVAGKGDGTVSWLQEDVVISDDYQINPSRVDQNRYSIISESVGVEFNLQISGVKALDAGKYRCKVDFRDGQQIFSTSAHLTYKYPPSNESPECRISTDITAQVGEQVDFSCRSELGVPPVQLEWSLDDTVLESTDLSDETAKNIVYQKTLGIQDNGKTFICTMSHELINQPRTCRLGPLIVQYPPIDLRIITSFNESTSHGDNVFFDCVGSANPAVESYTWSIIPEELNDKVEIIEKVLVITDIDYSFNNARITCRAENTLGSANVSKIVTVVVTTTKPTTTRPTTSQAQSTTTVSIGESLVSTTTMTQSNSIESSTFIAKPPIKNTFSSTANIKTADRKPTIAASSNNFIKFDKSTLFLLMIGVLLILFTCILLVLMINRHCGRKTVVYVGNDSKNTRRSSSSNSNEMQEISLRTRKISDNLSDNQSFDSAVHLLSPVSTLDHPDFRGVKVHHNQSNLSNLSSLGSGPGIHRSASTAMLIDTSDSNSLGGNRYIILDQAGKPFPSAMSNQIYQSATTGRLYKVRSNENNLDRTLHGSLDRASTNQQRYVTIPSGSGHRSTETCQAIPLDPGQIRLIIDKDVVSSEEDVALQEGRGLLGPKYNPV